ncbi:hypothetical protein K0B03_03360 [Patescibacteria group bacterium]|nr:hypothetical protein [Patescibacteria group bacterium]
MKLSKYAKFIFPSLIFYLMMEFFFRSFALSWSSLFALFLVSISSAFWITRYRFLPIILILLFTTGSVLTLVTIGRSGFQQLYTELVSITFFFALIGLYRFFIQEESWMRKESMKPKILDSGFNLNQTIIMISVFLISSGMYGLYIDFDLPLWSFSITIFTTTLFSTIYLTRINFLKSKAEELHLDTMKNKTFNFYSFLFGLIIVELTWAVSFWPANHLTIGAIILAIYYPYWNILKNYLRNSLTRTIVSNNILFFFIFLSITIIFSQWTIS